MKYTSFITTELDDAMLSLTGDGFKAYAKLMMAITVRGGFIKCDKAMIAKIIGIRPSSLDKIYDDVIAFFHYDNGELSHKNIKDYSKTSDKLSKDYEKIPENLPCKPLENNDIISSNRIEENRIEENNIKTITKVIAKKEPEIELFEKAEELVIEKPKAKLKRMVAIPLKNENYADLGELPELRADLADGFTKLSFEKGFDEKKTFSELRKFTDYHLSKCTKFADWQATCRTWLGNAKDWDRPPPRYPPRPTTTAQERKNEAFNDFFGSKDNDHGNIIDITPTGNPSAVYPRQAILG
jgi:hypothetical protein